MREKLWNLLDKTRYDYNYYQEYRQHLEKMRIIVVAVTSITAFVVISLSSLIDGLGVLWHLMLLASGVTAMIYEKLMIADRITALKYFIPELNQQLDELNVAWVNVNELYNYESEDIAKTYTNHLVAISKLTEKYIDDLYFPQHEKSAKKAIEITKHWAERLS